MRISVNLSLFFHDHRCSAKIFINKNIKIIQDLENRISEIFNIDNFYLKCDNQYLPSSEDIQVLNYDDVVWVLPNSEDSVLNRNIVVEQTIETEEDEEVIQKKKKKKRHRESPEEASGLPTPYKKKKREKKCERKTTREEKEQNSEAVPGNRKRRKKNEFQLSNDTSDCKDSGRASSDSIDMEVNHKTTSVKTLVDSFEKKKDLPMLLEHSFTPVLPKKINIVKTIIVSHDQLKPDSETSINGPENGILSKSSPQVDDASERIKISEEESPINEDHTTPDCSGISDNGIVQKRKRTRVRKRKKDRNTSLDGPQKTEDTVFKFIPRPLLTKPNSGQHVRFREGADVISSPVLDVANIERNSDPKPPMNKSLKIMDVTSVLNNNEFTEEFIVKQPLMTHILPRIGDIIAFKIIRMSDNYTPEISTRIVGKVSNYDLESMEVTFEVLRGQEQYAQPQGKFSLELNTEEAPEVSVVENTFQCVWSSILDPRLLYP